MKLSTLFLFFLLLAATTTACKSETSASSSCQRELMQHTIERCCSFLRHGPQQQSLMGIIVGDEDNEGLMVPEECCMQLRQVKDKCRCQAIRDMAKEVKWEEGFRGRECRGPCGEMMMRGRFLPAMCNMEPHTCRMRQAGGGH